jgi:hypothetical protein
MKKCLERVNDRHFLESWSLQLPNDTKMSPQLKIFFVIISIVYMFPTVGVEAHPPCMKSSLLVYPAADVVPSFASRFRAPVKHKPNSDHGLQPAFQQWRPSVEIRKDAIEFEV